MKLLLIGLGKMGGNMARRWLRAGHQVIGYNRSSGITDQIATEERLTPVYSIEEGIAKLTSPRVVWLMVPSGQATEDNLNHVAELLEAGDILVDGGNSNFNDSIRHGKMMAEKGIQFFDAGVSGGVWGLKEGYAVMVGGNSEAFNNIEPLVKSLAPAVDKGWGLVGPVGAGHFTKMVHNGIEYGMMEAYAEGYELMKSRADFQLDLHQVSEIWRYSSVVRSWLLDLISLALVEDQDLSKIKPWVTDSGEGRWTVNEAINQSVPVPVIAAALFRRFESREENSYAYKLLSAVRNQFGGHEMKTVE
ncbi:MAG: decarboxylating 6-phosphogluconate dehydrogenase [Leptolinea sp.]